jgi:hypothetical protein
LGGHSLKATRLISLIHKEFGLRVDLKYIFMESTIEGMGAGLSTDLWVRKADRSEQEDSNMETLFF